MLRSSVTTARRIAAFKAANRRPRLEKTGYPPRTRTYRPGSAGVGVVLAVSATTWGGAARPTAAGPITATTATSAPTRLDKTTPTSLVGGAISSGNPYPLVLEAPIASARR